MNETQVVPRQLVEAREDAAIVLEFVDKAFDQVPLAV
jgi:hypothetical protein